MAVLEKQLCGFQRVACMFLARIFREVPSSGLQRQDYRMIFPRATLVFYSPLQPLAVSPANGENGDG
jgi:hypothetical protein